jgi:hypothetical protein
MFVPHPFDIVAILLGIFLALRKSDVRAEDPSRHPRVALADFDSWRKNTLAAYSLGARACFAKVMADFAFLAVLQRTTMSLGLQRAIGVSLDAAWVIALVLCWVGTRKARKQALAIGMNLFRGRAREPLDSELQISESHADASKPTVP